MPIRPENMARYPGGSINSPEWQAIRAFMRARAGGRCEGCGVRHLTYGVRMDGEFTDLGRDKEAALIEYEFSIALARLMTGSAADGVAFPPLIRIVCTVAHLDHGLTDHSERNLRFLCQQCHNRHDAPARAQGIAARRPLPLLDVAGA